MDGFAGQLQCFRRFGKMLKRHSVMMLTLVPKELLLVDVSLMHRMTCFMGLVSCMPVHTMTQLYCKIVRAGLIQTGSSGHFYV